MYDRGKQMRVENYHDEDAAAVAELLSALPELASTSAEAFRSFAAQSYNRGARDFLTLRSGSQLIALLTSTLLPESAPPLRHFRILVHPGHRPRGLATRLPQALASQSLPTGGRLS